MGHLPFLLIALASSFTAIADTLVVPPSMAANDMRFGSGIFRAANYRAQAVYGSNLFPANIGLVITELRYRPDWFWGSAFTTTVANIQFNLSATTRSPEALSPNFANNVGSDDTVVFSGALNISSQFIGPPQGPKNFDIIVPLATPFLYNPAAGNLLIDVRNFSGSSASIYLSGTNNTTDGASRNGGVMTAGGSPDNGAEALQIIYTATNQPPPPPPPPPPPTEFTRPPYLQNATKSNIVVRWRSNYTTNSVVQFGLAADALPWAVTNVALTTSHAVTLTNLAPDTKYFYVVGTSGTNLAGGSNYFFITPPATQRPTRVWAIGDFGTASQPYFGLVNDVRGMRDSYYSYAGNRYTDVWLMLGDNAYGSGTDAEYQTNVFGIFPRMLRQSVAWSTIGNHDGVSPTVYNEVFDLPKDGEAGGVPSGTELYYSFDYGNIHFVCLDSEISSREVGGPMLMWLEQDLEANTNEWLIAFWHSPPYSYGSHDSDNFGETHLIAMRENALPILENFGVDLVLCGHSHVYERSFLLDGHYGFANTSFSSTMAKDGGSGRESDSGAYLKPSLGANPHEGAVYAVVGSSGWVTGPANPSRYLTHPAMFVSLEKVGSMVIDVSSNRLEAKMLSHTGTIEDYFTLLKGVAPELLKIKTFSFDAGNVVLQFKTIAGQRYQVMHATELGPSNWMPVSAAITATGATTRWSGSTPGSGNHFYQIVLLP
jgi:hypothetical protein